MQQGQQKLVFGLARLWIQQVPKHSKNLFPLHRCFASLPEEIKIPVPWGHVSGKWWNRDQSDPILAMHGWLGNAATFDRLIPLLSQDLSILVIDLPGFGLSSHLPPGCYYHRFSYVVIVKIIITYFKWKQLSLLGNAMGGSVSFLYSCIFPETVKSLCIVNAPMTPIPMDEVKYMEASGALIDQFLERDYRMSTSEPRAMFSSEEMIEITYSLYENLVSKETIQLLLERNMRCDSTEECYFSHDPRLKDSRLSGFSHNEILKLAKNLRTHVTFIHYDQCPYFMPKEIFNKSWEIIEASAKSAEKHILKGSRHELIEDPKSASLIINEHFTNYHLSSEAT